MPKLPEIESAEVTSNILTESITWNATQRFYLQGSVQLDHGRHETGYAKFAARWPFRHGQRLFRRSLTAGYAIDDKTDITGSFTYYGASNYSLTRTAMGYGPEHRGDRCQPDPDPGVDPQHDLEPALRYHHQQHRFSGSNRRVQRFRRPHGLNRLANPLLMWQIDPAVPGNQ